MAKKKLKKEIGLLGVFSIAAGTTLSAGFFLLPGLAAQQAGPALILAYVLAAIPLIPAMLSVVELATAMPKAGGVYYFLDRSLGPLVGTIGGIGTWLALILKVAFALIGMGAYISLFIPGLAIVPIAVFLAVALGLLNIFGAKKSGKFQIYLVVGLLSLLTYFIVGGIPELNYTHFNNFFDAGFDSIIATAGLVYISYVGVTNVASLAEEVHNPEKNLPIGVFLALGLAILIYILGTAVMVGVLPMSELKGTLTPVASAAKVFFGDWGMYILSIAAILAFVSVANAGTMSASRYPLAMSRDHIMPSYFKKLGRFDTPVHSIILTVSIIILLLVFLNPTGIAKLASAFQLLMFSFVCLAVIIMRESKIDSYDPGYKSPFYPWLHIFGIISSLYLIFEMGTLPIVFSSGLIIAGALWYWFYARGKVERNGAIYHIFERLGKQRFTGLDTELRGILKEKGLRKGDPFDKIVTESKVFDINEDITFSDAVNLSANLVSKSIPLSSEEIVKRIMEGTRVGATPVMHGVALPHFKCGGIEHSMLVLIRAKHGINIPIFNSLTYKEEDVQRVTAVFFLISPEKDPTQHLRILAQIAGRVDDESFTEEWENAKDEQELKEALMHDDNFKALYILKGRKTELFINKELKNIKFPNRCLVALLQRGGEIIVPKGNTQILEGDRITVIGDPKSMKELNKLYVE
ncbi:MAG: amino acid permease [Melioribacteraceae bacterium]|jgi:APA family basic amino acid/polyamine antiporter|nr:amino acid permease [Melioribacteraceae bacterium]